MSETTNQVRVKVGSESYIFDRDALTLTDLFAIKAASGLDSSPFLKGIGTGDPLAFQTLVWFVRNKAGIQGDPHQIDFKMGDFDLEPVEAEADPTVATSETSETAISDGSPISAA